MDAINASMTARASNALYNQVTREQASLAGAPFPASPQDLVNVSPPGDASNPVDFDSWMRKLAEAKREALRRAAQRSGEGRPTPPDKPRSGQSGPLTATAHGFYEGSSFVPVQQIRIYEVGNYGHRTYQSFGGGWPEYSWKMSDARVGKDYKVQVTWANGYSETRDVHMSSAGGASLDIYRY